ncbi:MAG: sulfatase-like hydrolase/transferase, partial [Verrucomicrobiia bacterium]
EGMELNRYYGHPTCVPTRVALYTGRNPYRFGITSPGTGNPPLAEHFLPQTLKQSGYTTRLVGKWHGGGPEDDPLSRRHYHRNQ